MNSKRVGWRWGIGAAVVTCAAVSLLIPGALGYAHGATTRSSGEPPSSVPDDETPAGISRARHIYWSNNNRSLGSTIGRASIDGTAVDQSFVKGVNGPADVRVDGAHIYWDNAGTGFISASIGRANIDGTGVNPNFIPTALTPGGVAVDSKYVYWTNTGPAVAFGCGTTIGRAKLDGTEVNQSFITDAGSPNAIEVNDGHVYWTNIGCPPGSGTSIGRANLDGTHVEKEFLRGLGGGPTGLAVDDRHIYWGTIAGTSIGRADLDGSHLDNDFIMGARGPGGVAVDCGHIYWANLEQFRGTTIGRAKLDGSDVQQEFITGAQAPAGIAVERPKSCTAKARGGGRPHVLGARYGLLPAAGSSLRRAWLGAAFVFAGAVMRRRAARDPS